MKHKILKHKAWTALRWFLIVEGLLYFVFSYSVGNDPTSGLTFWIPVIVICIYFELKANKNLGIESLKTKRNTIFYGFAGTLLATFLMVTSLVSSLNNKPTAEQTQISPAVGEETYTPPTVAELLMLVNAERAKVGVQPLIEDTRLNKSAQFKADDMTAKNYTSHIDPTTGVKNGLEKEHELAPECMTVSENISRLGSEKTSQAAVDGWVKSTTHYKAMVDEKYTITGFGISGIHIVEHFC